MNGKPRLLVTRKLPEAVLERAARDYDARLNPEDRLYGPDELIERAAGCDAILTCSTEKFDAEVIARLPASVRAVATFSVGIEHFDLEAARKRGLVMTNTPDVLTDSTADITMLVLLGAARRAQEGQQMVREDKWFGWAPTQLLGVHVSGKRLGILGMGRIGRAVAKRARGFDMEIHYHNRSRLSPELEQGAVYHEDGLEALAILKSRTELLGEIISVLMAPMIHVVGGLQAQGENLLGAIRTISERENGKLAGISGEQV
ncbi:MAG: hypothetical protein IH900_12490 [Proteobacteria bacterium]|nr:hypothetical protein [Pseudomonadota bacterium]